MAWTAFSNQVQVTAQVQIIGSKSKKRLTQCENFSFNAMLKEDVSDSTQRLHMETLALSRFKDEFLNRIRTKPEVKHLIGSTQWEVQVMAVQYD